MRLKPLLYLVMAVFLLLGGVSLWMSVQQTQQPEQQVQQQNQGSDMEAEGVSLTVTVKDTKKWDLNVEKAIYDKSKTVAQLSGVTGQFYNLKGETVATFKSPAGVYDDAKKSMKLTGGAVVNSLSSENTFLKAPMVTWSASSDQIKANGGVHIQMGEGMTANSDACEFSLDFSTISMSGQTRTQVAQ